jgi:hypothetical protein
VTRLYRAGEREALLEAFWLRQKGFCELGARCLVGKPLVRPSEWLRLPARERRKLIRDEPTLDHVEGYRDSLHVRGVCHRACNRAIHAAYFRRLHAEAVLREAGFPVPPLGTPSGGAGERKPNAPSPLPSPPSPEELSKMLGPSRFRVVPDEKDSFSNRLHAQAAPVARERWLERVKEGGFDENGFPAGKFYKRRELVAWIAELVGEETVTVDRYADRYCSFAGPCEERDSGELGPERKKNGVEVVIFREKELYELEVPELLRLYPEEGQRAVDPAEREGLLNLAKERWEARERAMVEKRFGATGK